LENITQLNQKNKSGSLKPIITIFTAPKPFGKNPHIDIIQRNCILTCKHLGAEVEFVLIGYEDGIAETAKELGVKCFTNVRTTPQGTPLVSSIFELARSANDSPLLSVINADNLLLPDYVAAAKAMLQQADKFLMCGQRLDVDINKPLDFSPGWQNNLRQCILKEGKPLGIVGSDFFIFPRQCYTDMPDFAIGRSGWDNWMIYKARREGWMTVDFTDAVTVGHENHDYSHLPGGKPPYRLPETQNNIRLAGGKYHLFLLNDSNWIMNSERQVVRPKITWKKFWREFEIFPLVKWHSDFLYKFTYAITRPKKAWNDFKTWAVQLLRKIGLKKQISEKTE
jgi:hypothetical protein